MAVEQPFLIECPACGIDNVFSDFTAGKSAVCNQCRERLLSPDLINSHKGHTCDNCDMAFILKNETEFMSGESECQCGGSDFSVIDIGPFVANLQTVEASSFDEDESKDDDFDWCKLCIRRASRYRPTLFRQNSFRVKNYLLIIILT